MGGFVGYVQVSDSTEQGVMHHVSILDDHDNTIVKWPE